jgi:hypothetical protein
VPHCYYTRKPAPLPPPVAALLQIIDYPGMVVQFDGASPGIPFVDPPGLNIVWVLDPTCRGYYQYR